MRQDAASYVVAAMLALAGIAIAVIVGYRFATGLPERSRFVAPGSGTVEVAAPGDYIIWHEHRIFFAGRAYDQEPPLPEGMRLRVTDPAGRDVAVSAHGGASTKWGTEESVSVARFTAASPGRYTVSAEGDPEPRVLAVGPDFLWALFQTIAIALAALAVGIGGGGALALYAFLQRGTASAPPARAAPGTPARDQALHQLATLVYGLQAVALALGVTAIAGVIIDYLKRDEAAGTWYASHLDWQIRTFWWALLWSVIGFATLMVGVGFLVILAATVWYVWRIVKGWTALNDGEPVGAVATPPRVG